MSVDEGMEISRVSLSRWYGSGLEEKRSSSVWNRIVSTNMFTALLRTIVVDAHED